MAELLSVITRQPLQLLSRRIVTFNFCAIHMHLLTYLLAQCYKVYMDHVFVSCKLVSYGY